MRTIDIANGSLDFPGAALAMQVHLKNGGDFAVVFFVGGLLLPLILASLIFLVPKMEKQMLIIQNVTYKGSKLTMEESISIRQSLEMQRLWTNLSTHW